MKAITDIVSLIVAAVAGLFAILNYYWFATHRLPGGGYDVQGAQSSHYLWYAIGATIIACLAAGYYFLRHANKEEEIHITR